MGSNYPTQLDSFHVEAADPDTGGGYPPRLNDVADAINRVQAELGTDPAAGYDTVADRLDSGGGSFTGNLADNTLTIDGTGASASPNYTAAGIDATHLVANATGLTAGQQFEPWRFDASVTATDLTFDTAPSLGVCSRHIFGTGGAASKGRTHSFTAESIIQGCGDTNSEYAAYYGWQTAQMGTGYTQSAGPVGRFWFTDFKQSGPIAVQPDVLAGITLLQNNHYNGAPSSMPSSGIAVVTQYGRGDAPHAAATTYPISHGIYVGGFSSTNGTVQNVGFTTAVKVGGTGSPWPITASRFTNAIEIADFDTYGIHITGKYTGSSPSAAIAVAAGAGKVLSGRVTDGGFVGTAIFQAATDAENGLMVMQKSGTQSANIFQVTNSSGTELVGVSPVGHLRLIGVNMILTASPGTQIGTAASQKLSFYGATTVVQPSTTGETVGFVAGAGTAVNDQSTFTGNVGTKAYRISDVVKALKNLGLLASS